jgi:peptidoglycan hydrolase-like protein with peptidoglycan-binding domain
MKLSHYAIAGIAAASFATAAMAGGGAKHQQQSQGPDTIKQAQQQLSSNGQEVQVDGKLGPQTQAALKKFQESKGLQPSGQLDQQTLAALGMGEASASTGSSAKPSSPESSSGESSSGQSSSGQSAPAAPESSSERTAEPKASGEQPK